MVLEGAWQAWKKNSNGTDSPVSRRVDQVRVRRRQWYHKNLLRSEFWRIWGFLWRDNYNGNPFNIAGTEFWQARFLRVGYCVSLTDSPTIFSGPPLLWIWWCVKWSSIHVAGDCSGWRCQRRGKCLKYFRAWSYHCACHLKGCGGSRRRLSPSFLWSEWEAALTREFSATK